MVEVREQRPANRVSRRRLRGHFRRKRLDRSFDDDRAVKTPQAIPQDLEDERELDEELHEAALHEIMVLEQMHQEDMRLDDPQEVAAFVAEARELMYRLNSLYGFEMGEVKVADRMFATNLEGRINVVARTGAIDPQMRAMVRAMRSVGRGPNVGTGALAQAAAARNLIGGPSHNEAELLWIERQLRADRYREMVGIVDRISRERELAYAERLEIDEPPTRVDALAVERQRDSAAERERERDRSVEHDRDREVDRERERGREAPTLGREFLERKLQGPETT